jgi:hypothetical protein
MTEIIITINSELTSDFLGSMVIDILHDAKGRGILKGRKLHEITDIIAESISVSKSHEMTDSSESISVSNNTKNWVFTQVFKYIYNLWIDNISCLGTFQAPDFHDSNFNISYYRKHVLLPIKKSAETSDAFASLGPNRKGVECESFLLHKSKLDSSKVYTFKSPSGNFYNESMLFVDAIKKSRGNTLISLDMKSAAGLIRSTTDPIGYISGIATYADPGYNMAGMSAIRKFSKIDFIQKNHNSFSYRINLEIDKTIVKFFEAEYYWSPSKDIREHLLIKISDHFFHRSLPKSKDMADALEKYLNCEKNITIWNSKEKMDDIYKTLYANKISEDEYAIIYTKLHKGLDYKSELATICSSFDIIKLQSWCKNSVLNVAYIVSSLKLFDYYNINSSYIFPEDVIDKLFPVLLENPSTTMLFYIDHHLNLIIQYITHPEDIFGDITYQNYLKEKLDKRIGKFKLLNLRERLIKNVYDSYKEILVKNTIENVLKNIIENKEYKINETVKEILKQHVALFEPAFLKMKFDADLEKMSLLELCLRLNIFPEYDFTVEESALPDALKNVLGKFSGDFGQIVWCMATGNIFASEDNNSSAIACILHRVSPENIIGLHENGWANIHGMGDGGEVIACLG